jgi:hypothetical protein
MDGELNETQKILDQMVAHHHRWYEEAMDTSGLAYLFNELVKKAICFDEKVESYDALLKRERHGKNKPSL